MPGLQSWFNHCLAIGPKQSHLESHFFNYNMGDIIAILSGYSEGNIS